MSQQRRRFRWVTGLVVLGLVAAGCGGEADTEVIGATEEPATETAPPTEGPATETAPTDAEATEAAPTEAGAADRSDPGAAGVEAAARQLLEASGFGDVDDAFAILSAECLASADLEALRAEIEFGREFLATLTASGDLSGVTIGPIEVVDLVEGESAGAIAAILIDGEDPFAEFNEGDPGEAVPFIYEDGAWVTTDCEPDDGSEGGDDLGLPPPGGGGAPVPSGVAALLYDLDDGDPASSFVRFANATWRADSFDDPLDVRGPEASWMNGFERTGSRITLGVRSDDPVDLTTRCAEIAPVAAWFVDLEAIDVGLSASATGDFEENRVRCEPAPAVEDPVLATAPASADAVLNRAAAYVLGIYDFFNDELSISRVSIDVAATPLVVTASLEASLEADTAAEPADACAALAPVFAALARDQSGAAVPYVLVIDTVTC